MNVLILGGNGYLGNKITREIVNAGHSVVCTKREQSNFSKLSDIMSRITTIPASIDGIKSFCNNVKIDYVLNLACNYGRENSTYYDVFESNLEFPVKVLDTVVKYGTKNYLTIGTSLPCDFNIYSFTKNKFGEFGKFYAEIKNINFINIQLEMFYGSDEPSNRFIPSIVTKMINGEVVETTIGSQRRDIIWIDDAVKGIISVFNTSMEGYNEVPLGTGVAPSISELVDFIWESTGKRSEVKKGAVPLRTCEPDCVANLCLLKTICDWNPVFWKDGIRNMLMEIEECKKTGFCMQKCEDA